jgi:hypothetical protein
MVFSDEKNHVNVFFLKIFCELKKPLYLKALINMSYSAIILSNLAHKLFLNIKERDKFSI